MNKSMAVLGLGRFGMSVAKELASMGAEVLAVDSSEERTISISDTVTCAVNADIRDASVMKSLGISNMDAVVVAMAHDLEASIVSVLLSKDLGVPYVVAKAKDEVMGNILKKIGADKVVYPEKETGERLAKTIMSSDFLDFLDLSETISLVEMLPKASWVGKTLKELDLRKHYHLNVIAIKKNDEIMAMIDPDEPLRADTPLITTIAKKDLKRLI